MAIRYLKMIFVFFESLLCLFYASNNVVNIHTAYQAVAYSTSRQDQHIYAHAFGPGFGQPWLVWLTLIGIIVLEYTAGFLSAKGLFDLWRKRKSSADVFNASKSFALWGAGTAIINWFGLFSVVGGAYFQIWQTQAGAGALEGAFYYTIFSAMVLFFVNMKDD